MTRTTRIALTALTACAIAAPAAPAAGQDLRNPDQRTPASPHQDLRNPDQRTPARVLAVSAASDTVDDSRRPSPPRAEVETPSGFAWGGASFGAVFVLLVSGAVISVRRHRRRRTETAIA